MFLSARSPIWRVLSHPSGRELLAEYLPGANTRPDAELASMPIGFMARIEPTLAGNPERVAELVAKVEALELPDTREKDTVVVSDAYDGDAAPASAPWTVTTPAPVAYRPVEVVLDGPSHGNPYVDVELSASVSSASGSIQVTGFYDGDGRHVFRFLPGAPGTFTFRTSSNARSLDGVEGSVEVAAAPEGAHGSVHVEGFGFRHADGTRHLPLGTTAYVWTHQSTALQEQTLATLADGPFTKIRMCVFPKSYKYNTAEPPLHGFERKADGTFDTQRFVPEFFRHFESRVADLDAIGVQADVILLHPYDRWGYSDLGPVADDRYLRYVVARLSAYPNVWWSMANEYDLMTTKTLDDWDRLAGVVQANDPVGHLIGNHNCMEMFDHSRPWVTHSSIQRMDMYRTAENTDAWRREWGKPVVIDECAYEGDIDLGWGNIGGEEMTRRFWEAAVRGGWCGHGETYCSDDDILWWSHGGPLKGTSPARIAFLRRILEEAPGDLEPAGEWDVPAGIVGDSYRLVYFSFMQPRFRNLLLPAGRWQVDVIDTWGMTVTPVSGSFEGVATVDLPGRPYMAVRLTRVLEPAG